MRICRAGWESRWRLASRRTQQNGLEPLRKGDVFLYVARELASARSNERYRCGIGNNSRKFFAQRGDIVYILDCDTTVTVREPLPARKFPNDFCGSDQACPAKQDFEW